jgi:malonate decarboxylase beta subunit
MSADIAQFLRRDSFIERGARSRAQVLLDAGTMRELAGPFERLHSPWLAMQHLVTQADDGVVVAKGLLDGRPTVVLAIEGAYQGGSMGEIGGAKIAGALELAARDNRRGIPMQVVILFETGGVRLQEANLGLAAIAEIQSAIVDLRRYTPVVGVSAGTVGCYGGMSIAAGLCSYLVLTREARLGLNGPQVIEQEAGVAEFDARQRSLIWSLTGGEQRVATGLADACVEDDRAEIRATVARLFAQGVPAQHRSERAAEYLARLQRVDTVAQPTAQDVRAIYPQGDA